MTTANCPQCGSEIPVEAGQHALVPSTGLVHCPTCGEKVTLPKAESVGGDANGGDEYFAGHETIEGVMQEIDEKEES